VDGNIRINNYFKNNPDMMVGEMTLQGSMYGENEPALLPYEDRPLIPDLNEALAKLPEAVIPAREGGQATAIDVAPLIGEANDEEGSMRALPNGTILQVKAGQLVEAKVAKTQQRNVKALIELRDQTREIIRLQMRDAPQAEIDAAQGRLGKLYDAYTRKRGPINFEKVAKNGTVSRPNLVPFRSDPGMPLVASIEEYNSEDQTAKKGAIFSERVVNATQKIIEVQSVSDALPVSLAMKGVVDIPFMAELSSKTQQEVVDALAGRIFMDPTQERWVPEDEYLSGNVKQKLYVAKRRLGLGQEFQQHGTEPMATMEANVAALEVVQPEDIGPANISIRIGAPWVSPQIYASFLNELLETGHYGQVRFGHSEEMALWSIEAGGKQHGVKATTVYGTERINAVNIFLQALNLKKPTIYDKDFDGKNVKNITETLRAREKLDLLEDAFKDWVWKSAFATDMVQEYNERFNNTRIREFDGSHLDPVGISPSITLQEQQLDGAWRIISTGNTLLAHVVGGGKTFTMVVAAMEQKRMGLVNKPMIVVPNHMLEQVSGDFLQLYPNARILTAPKTEFGDQVKRRALLARIATGNWDAVIITHSAFGRINVSAERRKAFVRSQMDELTGIIERANKDKDKSIIKKLVAARKRLAVKLDQLQKSEDKDPGLTFEELGVDQLFIDEAHYFKNLYAPTKMQNSGLGQAGRSTDLYLKTQVLEGVNPGRGTIFATGTPISNTMSEVFTMMRYLQPDLLEQRGMSSFDAWAAQFGEVVSRAEMAPDGSGYRIHDRFARFVNVPELSQMYRQVWDIKRQEHLNLPVPAIMGGAAEVIASPGSDALKAFVETLVVRSENLANVDPKDDNMLKITGEGRKAALDMRLIDPSLPADPERKAAKAAERIFDQWEAGADSKMTQLVFIDWSAPKKDGSFNVYDDIRDLLIDYGIPSEEIAYIHDHDTDIQKAALFRQVREGRIRVLMGSTEKMGTGTNVQKRVGRIHHIDAPWRPADIEQRDGRGVRQGNDNETIGINRYVTEGSFDAYMWQGLERKEFNIEQIMSGDPNIRTIEDIGGTALNASEVKAISSGNPLAIEKASVDNDLGRLRRQKATFTNDQYEITKKLHLLPKQIDASRAQLKAAEEDVARIEDVEDEKFAITVNGVLYSAPSGKEKDVKAARKNAGEALKEIMDEIDLVPHQIARASKEQEAERRKKAGPRQVGMFAGFEIWVGRGAWSATSDIALRGNNEFESHSTTGSVRSPHGLIQRLENIIPKFRAAVPSWEKAIEHGLSQLAQTKKLAGAEFAKEDQLQKLEARAAEINAALRLDVDRAGEDQISQDDEGTPDELYGEQEDTEDDLRGRGDAGFILFPTKPKPDPLFTSTDAEVEARFMENEGVKGDPLFSRTKDSLDALFANMRRTHPEINPDNSVSEAMTHDILRQFHSAHDFAIAMAYNEIRQVIDPLNKDKEKIRLMARALILPDILKDAENNLYDDRPGSVPFYGRKENETRSLDEILEVVEADLAGVHEALKENPDVMEALERRNEFAKALTHRLVEKSILPKEVLEDERYYHRQVFEHLSAKGFIAGGSQDVRQKKRGFMRERIGGGDFNTAYQESEMEWMSHAWEVLATVETLERLRQVNDIKGNLKAEAKVLNAQNFAQTWDPLLEDDPLLPYRTRIAFSNVALAKMAADGSLFMRGGQYNDLIEQLGDAYVEWKQEMEGLDIEDREPFIFNHDQWFYFLSDLLQKKAPGSLQAATIFKAIREKEATIKKTLGAKYINLRSAKALLKALAPEGYDVWQPARGNHFFLGTTIAEKVLNQLMEEGSRALLLEDVKQILVVGGPKEEWIIPSNVATVLDNVKPRGTDEIVERLWVKGQTSWKQWVLLNPMRSLKYNFNNFSGDLDIAFAYDPKIIFGFGKKAGGDLIKFNKGKASKELQEEMLLLVKLGVIGSGLRIAEIEDITEAGAFQFLTSESPNIVQKVATGYWKHVRNITDWRENILRVAAYRYFLERIEAGEESIYAASRKSEIDAITDKKERAAKLARELIGDYGNISKGGVWLRRHMIPFYSWIEINAPRYYRLLKNTQHEGQTAGRGRRMAGVAAKKTSMAVLKMQVMFILTNIWNHLFFDDEEEELGNNARGMHLILGRRSDGTIRSIRMPGAFGDALEWFNLQDYPADIRDLLAGKKDIQDMMWEAVKAPVERIINSWEPFAKTSAELIFGRSAYPTVFEEGKGVKISTRPVRDRWEHIWKVFSVDRLYRHVKGLPKRPSQGPVEDVLGALLLYSTDPGEAAHFMTKQLVSDYQEGRGRERLDFGTTEKSNALYYWKKAVQWGDEKAAEKWERIWREEYGGTDRGMALSLTKSAPLGGLAKKDQPAFLDSLDDDDRELVRDAMAWWSAIYGGSTGTSDSRPSRPENPNPRPDRPSRPSRPTIGG